MTARKTSHRARRALSITVGAVLTALIVLGWVFVNWATRRLKVAEAMGCLSSLKCALDGFATDFNGEYPSAETAALVTGRAARLESSNDYLRQLFLAGETQSESIFWVKHSRVTSGRPDDSITTCGRIDASEILQPGDCHWAYVSGQFNTSHRDRPILLDPFVPGTTAFDQELWDGKVLAITIGGSPGKTSMVCPVTASGRELLDDAGRDLLSPNSEPWRDSGLDPLKLLKQPEPPRDAAE